MINKQQESPISVGVRVTIVSVVVSLGLSVLKLTAGVVGNSSALISDGVNSLGDVASYSVVLGGVAVSGKKADSIHQYGHEKVESLVSVFLSFVICATGFGIGYRAIIQLIQPDTIVLPTLFPLVAAIISILLKFFLWYYTRRHAKNTQLNSLKALSIDHLSDILSSTGALIGVIGARLGISVLDPIASLLIALIIIRSAIEVLKSSVGVLMDSSVDSQTRLALESAIKEHKKVKKIDLLRTRLAGSGYWVEVEITCCRHLQFYEAHDVAEEVHKNIEKRFPKVKHIMIHTNPCSGNDPMCKDCQEDTRSKSDTSYPYNEKGAE